MAPRIRNLNKGTLFMSFSVVTLVKGRKKQLQNMLESIKQGSRLPSEVVIVWMEGKSEQSSVEDDDLNIKQIYIEKGTLPLAEARNQGFRNTSFNSVIFLDVDCICSPTLLENLLANLKQKTITSAFARYLPYIPFSGDYALTEADAYAHPKRAQLKAYEPLPHKKFWSLVFALYRDDFNEIGGFDEQFTGYGGEDTDFAERFNKLGFSFSLVEDEVLHQYHLKYSPPLNYVSAIVENANLFHTKHGYFPMYSWLQAFCQKRYVAFNANKNQFEVTRRPTLADINAVLSTQPY